MFLTPREIDKLQVQLDRKGLTLIPIKLHLKGSWIKLIIGILKLPIPKLKIKEKINKTKKENKINFCLELMNLIKSKLLILFKFFINFI